MVVQESTLYLKILPAAIVLVQPVNVLFCDFVALDIVTGAEAVMESVFVGG